MKMSIMCAASAMTPKLDHDPDYATTHAGLPPRWGYPQRESRLGLRSGRRRLNRTTKVVMLPI
ncbi:hypothetical protein M758_4G009500 [Ceratodon purpureus]|uniref:Uncharacterized protein n=1 Tax=Ceratodon purpureus TaxID=3225 RepID=A0A8T0I6Y1_CERPU|nr:hypothetical protein KC19_4G010300 [Ceratodon purpureus]KAG0617718.1 hypothetical protein M758_4G009500 [Ceratodon purpureus]